MNRFRALLALLGVALGVATLASIASAQAPNDRARSVLHQPAYAFCNDAQRWVRPSELRYCGYVDRASACPAFVLACESTLHPKRASCNAPATVGSAANATGKVVVVFALVLAAALLVLLVRGAIRAGRSEGALASKTVSVERESRVPVPIASSSELFARALDAHERGNERHALFTMYAALLRKLDETGVIRIDPSFTNGDYMRACKSPAAKAPLRETVREVERVRFGGATASADAFVRLRTRVEPIVRAMTLLAFLCWVGSAPGCDADRSGGGDVSETSAGGDRAVREVLSAAGIRARRLTDAPEEVHDTSRVLLLNHALVHLDPDQWRALLEWVDRGGWLIVAGGTSEWPRDLGVTPSSTLRGTENVVLDEKLFGGLSAHVMANSAELDPGPSGDVWAQFDDGNPFAVRLDRHQGRVLALANADLLSNAGLAISGNADALVALLRAFARDRDVFFVEDAEGAASNPIRALARAGLLALILQGLLVLTLFYVMVGRHFGTPRDRLSLARRSFAEHVRAVGYLYARARSSRAALRAYSKFVLERIRDRVAVHGGSLPEAIAARVGEPREEVEAVCRAVEQAQGSDSMRGSEAEDLRLIKKLNDWFGQLA